MKTIATAVLAILLSASAVAGGGNYRTHCQGANEVPPVDTQAQCQAIFQRTRDGSGLQYKLIVANAEFVTQAHIHLGTEGANGPVVAFLFGFVPEGDSSNGPLAQGVITDANLIGPMAGGTIEDLITQIESGNTYVNVHTQQNPAGEVRGQIH